MNATSTHTRPSRRNRRLLGGAVAVAGLALLASTAPGVAGSLVTSKDLAKGAVTTSKIAKKAVVTKKIADGAIKTKKIANDAVTADKLANGSVGRDQLAPELQPLWAFVWGGPTINKGRGAVAVESLSAGNYILTFDRNVSACGYTATMAAPTSVSPEQVGFISVSSSTADPKAVNVRTRDFDGTPAAHGFTVQVWC
ncbi:hypothetical protein [Nocardioides halotolerans]|uniref:hypothetical protein n=1 Tax=Nocardioides halotolerans TaxID=433660 RepID=UPI00041AA749|nr:hypothetical protein [Nocardioides halotolerans]